MEHAVYLCSWRRSRKGFQLWVRSRPQIVGTAATYEEAEEILISAIQDAGGAMQAVLEFDPPLPRSAIEAKYSSPQILLICGDDRFESNAPRWCASESAKEREERMRWVDSFYESPVCRVCRQASGRRSEKPITLEYAPARYDGAFGSISSDGGSNHQIVSEEFLALLTVAEKRRLEFRPTERKGRRRFFELIGPKGPELVAVAGLKHTGWQCRECGYRIWGYWIDGMAMHSFVAASDLPRVRLGVFTVGSAPNIELAVSATRWREMVGRKGTRGFSSCPLGVVPAREVVQFPTLAGRGRRLTRKGG